MSKRIWPYAPGKTALPAMLLALFAFPAAAAQEAFGNRAADFNSAIPAVSQREELKSRHAALENDIMPQVRLGDRFFSQKDYQNAISAYSRAEFIASQKSLGRGEAITAIRATIRNKLRMTREKWGYVIFLKAKEQYVAALTVKDSAAQIKALTSAQLTASSSLPIYYAGKNIPQLQLDSLMHAAPAFQEKVNTFLADCDKLKDHCRFQDETSRDNVDPDYARRSREIKLLIAQAQIQYRAKKYEKVRDLMEKVLVDDPYNQQAITLLNKIYKKLYYVGAGRAENDAVEQAVEAEWKWNEPVPDSGSAGEEMAPREHVETRKTLYDKLQKIIVDSIEFTGKDTNIGSIVKYLQEISKEQDPDKKGVVIIPPTRPELRDIKFPYLKLEHVSLYDVIKYVCDIAGLQFNIDEHAIKIDDASAGGSGGMVTRTLPVSQSLIAQIRTTMGLGTQETKQEDNKKLSEQETFSDKALSEATDEKEKPVVSDLPPDKLKEFFTPLGVKFKDDEGKDIPGASISYNAFNNILTVRHTPKNIYNLGVLLKELDNSALVLVDAKIMEVSMHTMEELGFDWTLTYDFGLTSHRIGFSGIKPDSFYSGQRAPYLIKGLKVIPNFGNNEQFNLLFSMRGLDQKNRGELLATPRLLVANGIEGKLEIGEDRYFPESWTEPKVEIVNGTSFTYTQPTPQFGSQTHVGTQFSVTPTVINNYLIELKVATTITRFTGWSSFDYSLVIGDAMQSIAMTEEEAAIEGKDYKPKMKMPTLSGNSIQTKVQIYDGETIVIGGILEDKAERREDKYPFLGDLPLIGRLFTNSRSESQKKNLMIFVTARLMKNNGRPLREVRKKGCLNSTTTNPEWNGSHE